MKKPDRLLLGGGLAASLLGFYAFYPAAREDEATVLLVPPAERRVAAAAPPAPEPPPAQEPPPSADGLRLHGLTATGAIIGFQGGVQRLVPIGRDVLPGLKLREVRQHSAVLASRSGTIELGFTGPVPAAGGGEASAPAAAEASRPRRRREEVLQYRFGLAARRAGGRTTGYALRPRAPMPLLQRAGLRPGDVLVAVNGQPFDSDEKVMELATEIAGAFEAEFEFERDGRRMRAVLPVNPRPRS